MKKIFVAGHNGMVGAAICRLLEAQNDSIVIKKNRKELDLTNQRMVFNFFKNERPDEVILAAAKVGGIMANSKFPAEFIYENLQIQNNIIHSSHLFNINKLLFLGSSCIYPKFSKQPIIENSLLSGGLEPTNEPYAISKIAGIKMCESYNLQYNHDFRAIMPCNLYGPGDDYSSNNSHVIPALIRRIHNAKIAKKKKVIIWGTGNPMREFLFVDDLAEASIFLHDLDKITFNDKILEKKISHINVGTGKDISIGELAKKIKSIVGYRGDLIFDINKPDGTPRKLLNIDLVSKLGWKAKTNLTEGLELSYKAFLKEKNHN